MSKQKSLPLKLRRLEGKLAVISGAAQGIGLGIAYIFAEHGAKLALLDIATFDDVISAIKSNPNMGNKDDIDMYIKTKLLCLKTDISSEQEISNSVEKMKRFFGEHNKVDIIVNNAARFIFHSVLTATNMDWDNSFNVNIKGHAFVMKSIIKTHDYMNNGGSIINVCSISSYFAQPKCITYSAGKAALLQMTKNTSIDLWDKYNIRVNAICPSTVVTKASLKEMKDQGWTRDEWIKIKTKAQIIKRCGTIYEMGYAALFFASDESKFCTGTSLMVDGGYSAL